TPAFGRAVLIVGVLLATAMLLGRVDLVVLAAPFAFGAALGIWRRPSRVPLVSVHMGADFIGEAGRVAAGLSVANPDEVRYDLVVLRTAISPWLVVPHGDRPYVTTVSPGTAADLELRAQATRWGRPALGCAASPGGSRCVPASCTSPPRCPTATPRWCSSSTCCTRPAGPAGSAAPVRYWTPPSGPPPASPSTTCTGATGWRCWSTASGRVGCARAAAAGTTTPCWSGCSASARPVPGSSPRPTPSARTPSRPTRWSWYSRRCWMCGRRR